MIGKILRIVGIVLIVAVLGFGVISATTPKTTAEKVWDERTTVGSMEAKNHFVAYSDLMCPYCVAFENAIFENEEEFEQYLADNDILFEVRISDYLYNYGESNSVNSRYSAEALYCARNEGKFWDYYEIATTTVWNDYFKVSGKGAFTEMNKLEKDYWIDLGKEVGLGESFENCVKNDETLAEADANAEKSAAESGGLPYFVFNNYKLSGFNLTWGWDEVLDYFEKGLAN